jgi:hypothetical protein
MSADEGWEPFRNFDDAGSAQVMCTWLLREQVPAKVIPRTLENGLEADYCVFVASSLAHRARWVVAQLPPTDEELEFLATGKLHGDRGDGI